MSVDRRSLDSVETNKLFNCPIKVATRRVLSL